MPSEPVTGLPGQELVFQRDTADAPAGYLGAALLSMDQTSVLWKGGEPAESSIGLGSTAITAAETDLRAAMEFFAPSDSKTEWGTFRGGDALFGQSERLEFVMWVEDGALRSVQRTADVAMPIAELAETIGPVDDETWNGMIADQESEETRLRRPAVEPGCDRREPWAVWDRRTVVRHVLCRAVAAVVGACVVSACSEPTSDTVPPSPAPTGATTPVPPSVDHTTSVETTRKPTNVPPDDVEVIVSAAGVDALLGSIEVRNLTVLETATAGQPLVRFDLVFENCCEEPNRLVFGAGDETAAAVGDEPVLEVAGPGCADTVACTGDERVVEMSASGPTEVSFELTPLVDVAELVEAGTLRAELAPTFDYASPRRDDEVIAIELRIDIGARRPALSGDATPTRTATAPVTVVGGGFELLTFPFAGFADSAAQLDALLAGSITPVDTTTLSIDWTSHAAIVLTIPTDACPPLLVGFDIFDGQAVPVFVSAGYSACIQPLLSHTIIASVERAALLELDELVLPAEPSYFETPVVVPVDVTPGGPPPQLAERPAQDFGALAGTVALPRVGEANVDTLDDGTPVYVVHHHDGTVSVLDPRAPDPYIESNGAQVLVAWESATRNLLAGGAWDEYGRRLDGFRSTNLKGYATRVVDEVVEVGAPVEPPLGSPIASTDDPPAMSDVEISLDTAISLDAALDLPVGSTAVVDATVIVDSAGAFVCTATSPDLGVDTCPPGSPIAEGIEPEPGARTALFGPMLATRSEAGFTAIAPTGGYSGTAL